MRFRMVEAAVSPQIFREYSMLMRYRHYSAAQARLAARLESCSIVSAESPSGTTADGRPVSLKISYGETGRRDRQIGMFLIPTALENGEQVKEVQKAARHRDPGTTK